jgi:methionine-R-sulfoxide reductase
VNRRTWLKLTGIGMLETWAGFGCGPAGADDSANKTPTTQPGKEGFVKVKVFNRKGELVGPIEMPKVVKTDAQWKAQLSPEQYKIARAKGTEQPFCGNLLDNHQQGVYTCICCGLPLFAADSKFNSGTGWPSFFQPVAAENVIEHVDRAYGMERTEILCARCDCHLGHVFDDGPRPTGLRFCVNSESLAFTPSAKLQTLADPAAESGTATQPSKT